MLAKVGADIELQHYVLVTEPGAEFKAERHLRADGWNPWVPRETIIRNHKVRTYWGEVNRPRQVVRPIFRGYIIVPLNMAWSFGPLYSTPGLRQTPFLLICGKPAVLRPHDVQKLIDAESDLKDAPIQGLPYHVGDKVQITQGAFAGFTAEIARLDDEARIELLMELLGGRVKTHVTARQIEAID